MLKYLHASIDLEWILPMYLELELDLEHWDVDTVA